MYKNLTGSLQRISRFFNIKNSTIGSYVGKKIYFSTGDIEHEGVDVAFDEKPSRANLQVKEGQLLFAKMSNTDKTTIVTKKMEDNIYSTGFFSIEPKNINREYLFYLLQSPHFVGLKNANSVGTTQIALNESKLKQIEVEMITNLETQNNIAIFLHNSFNKIDSLIEIENQQIEKLKEYKQAVITETVTKGLDKNVPMKDSGVEWIGKIPVKWGCIPNKFLFQSGKGSLRIGPFGSSLRGKTLENGPYKIYNQAHLVSNDFSLNRHFVSDETYEELKTYEVLPDDILFSMMGTIGKCSIMPHGFQKGIMDSHLLKARLNELILPKYYLYVFDKDMSSCVISQLKYMSNGSIMDGLNSSIIKKVYIPLPSIDEQKEIISFLDEKCDEIDDLMSIKQKKIDELDEYKKSLIYEYVTGKKVVQE